MKTLHLFIIAISVTMIIVSTNTVLAQYGPGFSPVEHYPPTNDTTLKLLVMNSTEFKQKTTGYNYTFAGVNYDWISKGNNYYDLGGARVTFFVFGFGNETTKGEAFNLDSQMNIKNIFEYNADKPPAGYYTDRCMGCPLITGAKPECCGPAYVSPTLDTPLKQFKSGIAVNDVKCEQGFLLVYKSEDNHPYCTRPLTALHLMEIGWGQIASPFDTNTDLLNSKISGGIITGYHYDFQSKSLVIKTQAATNGTLTVTIPRKLLDAKTDGQDDHFYVLMNGQEIDFTETMTTDMDRTLLIPFTNGTQEIEIIGAQVL